MSAAEPSPAIYVRVTQALVAHELVHSFGMSEREAADLLGLVPSAVSQYLSGKRLRSELAAISLREEARRIARGVAQELIATDHPRELASGVILEAAREIASSVPSPSRGAGPLRSHAPGPADRDLIAFLSRRVTLEHTAVADCMQLAQKSRDELTRAIFRQIASDSLRHAEIVASLVSYLDRGLNATSATGITRSDIARLIRKEQVAESGTFPGLSEHLGGVMGLLWESMESDERKHEKILQHLLHGGLIQSSERAAPPSRRDARARPRS
ncbi:MAG: hypothetical protein ACREBT_06930 [Thermoplasmata archaeon]